MEETVFKTALGEIVIYSDDDGYEFDISFRKNEDDDPLDLFVIRAGEYGIAGYSYGKLGFPDDATDEFFFEKEGLDKMFN